MNVRRRGKAARWVLLCATVTSACASTGSKETADSAEALRTASTSGTTVPPASRIVDSQLAVWRLSSSGTISRDGQPAGYSANVTLLLYYDDVVYQENASSQWYSWTGSTWIDASDPRAPASGPPASGPPASGPSASGPSASGSTIPPSSELVDDQSNHWAVSNGVIYENGAPAGYSANVTLLLYYDSVIYQENAASQWYSWTGTTWIDASDPRVTPSPTPPPNPPPSSGSTVVISADYDTYNLGSGPFWADNSVWNKGNLVNGVDYTQSLTVNTGTFPSDTTIAWSWPSAPASYNVYSFPMVVWGNYTDFQIPAINVPSKQIDAIGALTISYDVSLAGSLDEFDCIFDQYLTSTPNSTTPFYEIEIAVHSPSYYASWVQSLPSWSFTDGNGTPWKIVSNAGASPKMIIFAPASFQDLPTYDVDFKALLLAAKADGLLSGSEYFNGLGLGAEPRSLGGSVTIHSLAVSYQ